MYEFEKKIIPGIRRVITIFYPLLFPIITFLAHNFLKILTFFYYLLLKLDWEKIPRTEWMDHDQDIFFQFNSNGNFLHFERGIIARLLVSNFFFFHLILISKKK